MGSLVPVWRRMHVHNRNKPILVTPYPALAFPFFKFVYVKTKQPKCVFRWIEMCLKSVGVAFRGLPILEIFTLMRVSWSYPRPILPRQNFPSFFFFLQEFDLKSSIREACTERQFIFQAYTRPNQILKCEKSESSLESGLRVVWLPPISRQLAAGKSVVVCVFSFNFESPNVFISQPLSTLLKSPVDVVQITDQNGPGIG